LKKQITPIQSTIKVPYKRRRP